MAQEDMQIADQNGLDFLNDLNSTIEALVTNSSGASAPATTYPFQLWADTTANKLKQRNAANDAWIIIGDLGAVTLGLLSRAGGTMTGALAMSGAAINETKGNDIASASTVNLDSATGNFVHITGTTAITAITLTSGRERTVVFDASLTLTHSSSLILPGQANITTQAGDVAIFRGEPTGVVRCVNYTRSSGAANTGNVPIGGYIEVQTNLTGAEEPNKSNFIKLTAGEDGAGQYNEGKLINESVTGTAPLVVATADIDDADSPLNGQTINLWNTENRYPMPGTSPGTVANDQLQNITGNLSGNYFRADTQTGAFGGGIGSAGLVASGSTNELSTNFDASRVARTGDHTNVKRQEVTYYMRYK